MKKIVRSISQPVLGIFLSGFILSAMAQQLSSSSDGGALSDELINKVTASVDSDTGRLQRIFKDIHQNPELGFMEVRTAGIVAKELKGLGYEVKTGIGKTGVVGILKNGEGPTVMYRADMDANAVEEATGLDIAGKIIEYIETHAKPGATKTKGKG